MILHELVGEDVTPFLRMRLPYLLSSPVMTTAKAPCARWQNSSRAIRTGATAEGT